MGFLNMELARLGLDKLEASVSGVIDTLKMAKESRPGQRNNLDALCRHFGIDNSKRTLHGALLDAELLGEVYIAMTRGQESLLMELTSTIEQVNDASIVVDLSRLKLVTADAEEVAAHAKYIEGLAKSGATPW
jgi:DNA polymerase-3 subunit epsilon